MQGPEGLLESYAYTRDARGYATTQVEEDGAMTTWAYDAAGRLVRVDYPADKIQSIRDEQDATIERLKPAPEEDENQGAEDEVDPAEAALDAQGTAGATGLGTRLADLACGGPVFLAAGQGSANGQGGGNGQGNANGRGNGGQGQGGQGNGDGGQGEGGNGKGHGADKGQGDAPDPEPDVNTTEAIVPAYTLPVRQWVEYQYDAAGNRVRETSDLGAMGHAYDEANRLLEAGDVSFACDAAGRLTRRLTGDEAVTYGYDAAGRLREVAYGDGTGVAYGYDALGRKVSREATFWSVPDPKRRGPSENGLEHGNGFEQGQHNGEENGQGHKKTPPGLCARLWDGVCLDGDVVLVVLTPVCPACSETLPSLANLQRTVARPGLNVRVLWVSQDEPAAPRTTLTEFWHAKTAAKTLAGD